MRLFRMSLLFAAVLSICGCASENLNSRKEKDMDSKSNILIGWASRDVTPKGKVNLAGQFHMRISSEIRDSLSVTALAVSSETSGDSFIFVSCDSVCIGTPLIEESKAIIKTISKDFPLDKLVLNATHAHTAPDIRDRTDKYSKLSAEEKKGLLYPEENRAFLVEKIAEAAVESWNSRIPGMLAWGFSDAVVGRNRRAVYLEDFSKQPDYKESPGRVIEKNARMYGKTENPFFSHIEGYEDHTVQFLLTFNMEGKLTGSIINMACPSQETGGASYVSADFWHEVRQLLREQYGEKFFILPQSSAAGDQTSYRMLNKAAEKRKLELKGIDARMDIARKVKQAFDDAYSWAPKDMRNDVNLKHVSKEINLTKRIITEKEYKQNLEWARQFDAMEKLDSRQQTFLQRCRDVVKRYEEQSQGTSQKQPVEIHVVKLGDIVFATNPFELFLDYGVRIQSRSPAVQTFIIQLAGKGIERGGSYLPTERAEAGGGYSATPYCNKVGSKGGQELVEETLKTINELWK